jgi:SAM-dependent methyltransferase
MLAAGAAMQEFRDLSEHNAELAAMRYMLPEAKQVEWVYSVGVSRFREIARHLPPLPPQHLRNKVAESDPELFLWTGLADAHAMLTVADRHAGGMAAEPLDVLDFGCGCGRVARFFTLLGNKVRFHGADVHPELVAWCRGALGQSSFFEVPVNPPTSLVRDRYGFIYSISVFTHLPEAVLRPWLRELAGLLRPGGVLAFTVHGRVALRRLAAEPKLQEIFRIDRAGADRAAAETEAAGLSYVRYEEERLAIARAGADYGTTFLSEPRVRDELLAAGLEPVEHIPGGLRGWQDLVVARRPRS